jgi:hypothetical protein
MVLGSAGLVTIPAAGEVAATLPVQPSTTTQPPVTTIVATDDELQEFGLAIGQGDRPAPGTSGNQGNGGESNCHWRDARLSSLPVVDPDQATRGPIITRHHPETNHPQKQQELVCGLGVSAIRWVDLRPPEPGDLIPGFYGRLVGRIPDPVPAINPPGPGYVNLGVWLAVEDPGPIVEAGPIGPFSVRLTATAVETTFVVDGEPITCPGTGTPIVDLDTVEEGPCGTTFDRASPPGRPVTIDIATTWAISYETSLGNGTMPSLTTTGSLAYEILEIQTVGTRG